VRNLKITLYCWIPWLHTWFLVCCMSIVIFGVLFWFHINLDALLFVKLIYYFFINQLGSFSLILQDKTMEAYCRWNKRRCNYNCWRFSTCPALEYEPLAMVDVEQLSQNEETNNISKSWVYGARSCVTPSNSALHEKHCLALHAVGPPFILRHAPPLAATWLCRGDSVSVGAAASPRATMRVAAG
jgi:hypothetical protein